MNDEEKLNIENTETCLQFLDLVGRKLFAFSPRINLTVIHGTEK